MKVNKNKMTDEQRKIYEFIESNVSPAHRMEATLLMGHLSYIKNECSKYAGQRCYGCPFYNEKDKYFEACLFRSCYPNEWNAEQMIINIFRKFN